MPDSASADASNSPASDTSEVATAAAPESEPIADSGSSAAGSQVLPPVTFPEASIRDPEAEATDLERRRSVIGLFERLRVEAEHRSGYDRDAVFGGWLYSGGMSTRERVLAAERLADGSWHSAYDNLVVADASKLDIDHLVPLAEAWESGGYAWTAATWRRFGNDLDDPRSLIAVTASTNRSKGAGDPADWLPPRTQYRCRYAADWVAVKTRWELSVDRREQAAIETLIDGCTGADFAGDPAAASPPDGLAGTPPTGAAPVESPSASRAQSDAGTDSESEDVATNDPNSAEPGSTASCTHWHAGHPKHTHTRRADGTVTGHSHPPSSQTKCGYLWQ
ncbi:HNH endonuclease family protein [Candidatus Poriferisodalis sp.]|uniref:HNH endonuclease family protein n=1 Tax=Candidatus Poriferisodalis sp. TaxID=3101277 RepID=UPI003B5B16AC